MNVRFGHATDAEDPDTLTRILLIVNSAYRLAYAECLEDPEVAQKLGQHELRDLLLETDSRNRRLLLAVAGGTIVGCVSMSTEWHGEQLGHFGLLATDPKLQQTGVARALLDRVEAECAEAGVGRIQCEQFVVQDASTNNNPVSFLSDWYLRRGFNIVSSRLVPAGLESCGTRTCLPLEMLIYVKHVSSQSL